MKFSQLKKGNWKVLFCIVRMLGALLLMGCGEDGKDGPPGPPGPEGPGVSAPTVETCSICRGPGKSADIAVAHPDPTGETVIISDITLTNTAGVDGGIPKVSFYLATAGGEPVTDLDAGLDVDNFQFMMANPHFVACDYNVLPMYSECYIKTAPPSESPYSKTRGGSNITWETRFLKS